MSAGGLFWALGRASATRVAAAGVGVCWVLVGCSPSGEASRSRGERCAFDSQCVGGVCSPESRGFPEGMCTDLCTDPGTSCGDGFTCTSMGSESNPLDVCLPSCKASTDCRKDYVCSVQEVCVPDCRVGPACQSGTVCSDTTGLCGGGGQVSGAVGAPCEKNADCDSNYCRSTTFFKGGLCTVDCASETCPDESLCATMPVGALCLPYCDELRPCRPGYACAFPPGPAIGEIRVCLPCLIGQPCDG